MGVLLCTEWAWDRQAFQGGSAPYIKLEGSCIIGMCMTLYLRQGLSHMIIISHQLLRHSPHQRLPMKEVLQQPWILNNADKSRIPKQASNRHIN